MLELRNKTDNGFANNTSATVNITNPQPQEIYIQKPLCEHVLASLNTFLNNPVNKDTIDLYEIVLSEVERPLFTKVMQHVRGNQTKAARLMGINRGTLRKKLKKYGLS
jgi:Fis family transcriptional regulator, factor for inversion stimulation protein